MQLGLRTKILVLCTAFGALFVASGVQAYLSSRSLADTAGRVAAVIDAMEHVQEFDERIQRALEELGHASEDGARARILRSELDVLQKTAKLYKISSADIVQPRQALRIGLSVPRLSRNFTYLAGQTHPDKDALRANIDSLTALAGEIEGMEDVNDGVLAALRGKISASRNIERRTVVVLLMVALSALSLTALLSHQIASPLGKLYRELARVGHGNLDTELDIRTGDEIEQVAKAFNKMITRLRDDEFLAASLQERLLPDLSPSVPGLNIYARQRQARLVGGDWYDYHVMDGTLAFTIADSSGKGMAGALLSTVAMTALRSQPKTRGNICRVLEQVNIAIESRLGGDNFVTLITGFADPLTGMVTIINCGHEQPLLYQAAEAEWGLADLPSTMPLGINADHFHPRPATVTLGPGDKLLFYTDGLHDVRNSARRFLSMEQVTAWLEELDSQPIHSKIEGLLRKTIEFAHGDIQDDITILCIEFEPVTSTIQADSPVM